MKKKTKSNNSISKKSKNTEDEAPDASVPKGRAAAVNYNSFVKLWRDALSPGDVARELGIKTNSASAIAGKLRKAGVDLQKFRRRGNQPIDVKHLNKIASGKAD